uniref:G_PROTEIN_RECEP_F1_2 domain-containing protein n=1 Tax=Rhabditophanes sp. KR3021 TaxID=114890 RepID=A0AC35UBU9_9BILA
MFEFNLKPSYLEKYYSCDYLTEAEWIEEMQPNKIIGISFILLASVFLIVYIPVIIVLSQNEFLTKSSCYSILLYISIIDSCTITINGIIFGYLSIRGDNLCTSYKMVMFAGEGSLIGWYITTSSVTILGINRLLEACNRTWANFFFEGKKVIFWLIASFAYGLFIGLFTPPMLFTGKHYAVFFNPFVDIEKVKPTYPEHYENWPHAYHNISICVILPILYATICAVFFCKLKSANSEAAQTSKTQNSLLIQSLLICTATFLAGSIYVR